MQDDEIDSPRELAYRRRLAAVRAALGHDHDDATGPQTLDDAIAALLLRHAAALEALGEAAEALTETLIYLNNDEIREFVRDALDAIRKVTP